MINNDCIRIGKLKKTKKASCYLHLEAFLFKGEDILWSHGQSPATEIQMYSGWWR